MKKNYNIQKNLNKFKKNSIKIRKIQKNQKIKTFQKNSKKFKKFKKIEINLKKLKKNRKNKKIQKNSKK